MDDKYYLEKDFDPKQLKVAQLRGILNEYQIEFASNAKKSQLVSLFETNIKSKQASLLNDYNYKINHGNNHGFIKGNKSPEPETKVSINDEANPKEAPDETTKKTKKNPTKITGEQYDIDKIIDNDSIDKLLHDTSKDVKKIKKDRKNGKSKSKQDDLDISNSKDIIDGKMTPSKTFSAISSESSPFTNENLFQSNDSKKRKRKSNHGDEQVKRLKSPPSKSIFDSDSDEIEILSPHKTPFKIKRSKKIKSPKQVPKSEVLSPKPDNNNQVQADLTNPGSPDKDLTKLASPIPSSPKVKVSTPTPKAAKVNKFDKIETPKLDKIQDSISTPKISHQSGIMPKSSSKKALNPNSSNASQHTIIQSSPSTFQKNTLEYSFKSADKSFNNENSNPKPSFTKSSSKINDKSRTIHESDDEDNDEAPPAGSIEEEAAAFDKELDRINRRNITSDALDLDLASQLGITVEGYNPTPRKSTIITTPKSARSSAKISRITTPRSSSKSTPSNLPRLTPKPRLQQITDANISSDEDDEEDTTKFSDITENIEKNIINLEKSIEQESKQVIKKLKVNVKVVPLILTFITWLFLVSLGLFGYWYHQQIYLIGYCGNEINTKTFPNTEYRIVEKFGNYLDNNFKPNCIPCPNHARCFPNLELGCFEDFVEHKPWNNFLFPTKKKCVPDTKKAEKLEIMIEVALDLLRTKNARKKCGISEDIEEAGVKLNDLHDLLLSMKAPYITTREFEELWGRSVIELEKEPDIIIGYSNVLSSTNGTSANYSETATISEKNKILRSTSLSNISLTCQLKNSIIGSLIQYKYNLIIISVLISVIKFIQYKYNQYKFELMKVDIIYGEVINKLQHEYKLYAQGNTKLPYIGSTQLRDLILANENNLNRRVSLWNKVVNKVEHNTNVQSKIIEDHGEIIKVWQWVSELGH